jgi:hypothetical protein
MQWPQWHVRRKMSRMFPSLCKAPITHSHSHSGRKTTAVLNRTKRAIPICFQGFRYWWHVGDNTSEFWVSGVLAEQCRNSLHIISFKILNLEWYCTRSKPETVSLLYGKQAKKGPKQLPTTPWASTLSQRGLLQFCHPPISGISDEQLIINMEL